MQLDPIKPMLKPPGTTHLKLKCDELLSSFAFKFNLRRYTVDRKRVNEFGRAYEAGAYTRSLQSST